MLIPKFSPLLSINLVASSLYELAFASLKHKKIFKNINASSIPHSNILRYLFCHLIQKIKFEQMLLVNASIDYLIHKSSLILANAIS